MTVRERATEICRRLTADVAEIAPQGIGRWARAWEVVDAPSVDFWVALMEWESNPSSEDAKDRVRSAYRTLIEAWHQASSEYAEVSEARK